jgi:membrane protein YdbS with pleckstrin-like domain
MDYKKLDKKVIKSWRIARSIFFVVLALVFAVADLIMRYKEFWDSVKIYILVGEGVLLFYTLLSLILYPMIEYRQWGYLVESDKVEIRHGIFFITTSVIPIIRIQHITESKGPINRKLGLTKLTIHTASGEFHIEGLSDETAAEISENLKSKLIAKADKAGS